MASRRSEKPAEDKTPSAPCDDPLTAGSLPFNECREISALFYDLAGSTHLLFELGLEEYGELLSDFQSRVRTIISSCGGVVREALGDGGIAIFGARAHADDAAVFAIRAGLELIAYYRQRDVGPFGKDLHLRVAVATSDVILVHEQSGIEDAFGSAPNLAARLQQLAPSDTVVVCSRTRELAARRYIYRHHGAYQVRGFEEPIDVWQILGPRRSPYRFMGSASLCGSMVGRQAELHAALDAWRQAASGDPQILVLEGDAGIGKSRLAYEIFRSNKSQKRRLLVFQCQPNGATSPFLPLAQRLQAEAGATIGTEGSLSAERLRTLLGRHGIFDERISEILLHAVGGSDRGAPTADSERTRMVEMLGWAVQHCLLAWTAKVPLLVAIEDYHWIDPASRGLVDLMVASMRRLPVLLLLTSRDPVELQATPVRRTTLRLGPLKPRETATMVRGISSENAFEPLPPDVIARLHRRTNGIPLLVEEACNWLGGLPASSRNGDWGEIVAATPLSTLGKTLSSRLATMGPAKRLAQIASALGRRFHRDWLEALLPGMAPQAVRSSLDALVEARILLRSRSGEYAFRHALLQEAIYRTLLGRTRSELHRSIYELATRQNALTRLPNAIVAHHAECCGLIEAAIALHVEVGKETFARAGAGQARQVLEHALALLKHVSDEGDRERLELRVLATLGPVLTSTEGTKSAAASALYERAVCLARKRPAEERGELFPVFWGWWYVGADFAVQRVRAEAVTRDLEDVRDPEVRLQVHHCAWAIDFNLGRHAGCVAAVDAGLELYVSGRGRENLTLYGGHDARVCGLGEKGLSLWLQGRPMEATALVSASLDWARRIGHVGSIAHALDISAMLHRYRCDFAELGRTSADMQRLARKNALPSLRAKARIYEGWCAGRTGEVQRGLKLIGRGFAIQREIGTREDFPVYSEMLADILLRAGAIEAARNVVADAIAEAQRTHHAFWLPVLYWRRASLEPDRDVALSWFSQALDCAREQGAAGLELSIFAEATTSDLVARLACPGICAVAASARKVEQDGPMAPVLSMVEGGIRSARCEEC